jgi:predicted permease
MSRTLSALKNLFRRDRQDRELEAELRSCQSLLEEEHIRAGMNSRDARRSARMELGGPEQLKEEVRSARAGAWLDTLWGDLRFAVRMLRKNPGFTLVAIVTLALGIGANAGIFSVVNGVLLNPLPYPHPEQLVTLHQSKPNFRSGSVSFLNFKDWKANNHTFSDMALSRGNSFTLTGLGESENVPALLVTSSYFSVLGTHPALGRDFRPGEDEVNAAPVVLVSDGFWHRKLGSDPAAIGGTLTLGGRNFTIVGVLPAHFTLPGTDPAQIELFVPVGQWGNSWLLRRSAGLGLHGIGRLKPGVTLAQASADMDSVAAALAMEYPSDDKDTGATLIPLRERLLGNIQPILLRLLGAVAFVLLIACVNVGNLLLARANFRQREVAIRSALGAGRGRLIRQLLTESILLSLVGGALGLLLASWGTGAALKVLPTALPRAEAVHLDARVLLFTFGISLLAGILFGLAPALKIAHADLHATLKEGGRGSSGSKQRAQGVLVATEMAMAIVLLIGAGLMMRTLSALWSVDPGFDPNNVLTFGLSFAPSLSAAPPEQVRATMRDVASRFSQVPGVEAVSYSWGASPLQSDDEELFWMQGQPKPASNYGMNWALRYIVSPDYLRILRTPLLAGRFFDAHDDHHTPLVVVVDDVFARQFFGQQNPIGKRLELDDSEFSGTEAEIVGVVGHVKQWGLDSDDQQQLRAEIYLPILQLSDAEMRQLAPGVGVVIRSASSPLAAFDALRRATSAMNSEQVIYGAQTMNEVISATIAARRFSMLVFGVFAAVALLLAMIGVYGVISYSVGRRTNEIGIRMALGAPRFSVWQLILGEGMRLAAAGALLGIAGALGLTRLLGSMLFGVSAHDPITFVAVSVLLVAVAALACSVPALRASRVDPVIALRHE